MRPTETLLAAVSAASSRTSGDLFLGDFTGYSMTILISGADIAGTLKLQASNDQTTYVDISGSSQAITSSADHLYSISDAQYLYVRCVWTASSGTGNITITGFVKEPYKARL